MTVSDTFDKLPGMKAVRVDVNDSRLSLRVSVEKDSPADSILKSCECPLVGVSLSRGLPDGNWYQLSIMSKPLMDRLVQSANAEKSQPTNEG